MINEWLVLDGGLGITKGFTDSAGSIIIHAFGAYFGLGLAMAFTQQKPSDSKNRKRSRSDRFRCLGVNGLMAFLAEFLQRAVGSPAQFQQTWVNTVLALSGATIATYLTSFIPE